MTKLIVLTPTKIKRYKTDQCAKVTWLCITIFINYYDKQ